MHSNQKAFTDKFDELARTIQEREQAISHLNTKLQEADVDRGQLLEELNMYKGRCSNLARDVELHYNHLNKMNSDNTGNSE